ncbi:5-bromo-4-chloroindolyl phosphate hydrolysis family protein [Desulfovibrio sp. OttesenSCG-928-G11]|nr:5-bromo-4-chloroindolyl phosphate hydrolysis family protein [Desulfovibrio sp. OttesenSCG-928-G11]
MPPYSGDQPDPLSGLLAQLGRALAFVGSHLLLFFSSLVVAGIVCATAAGLDEASLAALFVTAFFGFFLLLPARRPQNAGEAVPLATGLCLCLVWTALALPWQYTLIWGACAGFLTRFFAARGRLGLEFSALPFLLLGVFSYYAGLEGAGGLSAPVWSLPLFSLAGWAFLELPKLKSRRRQAAADRGKERDAALTGKLGDWQQSARLLDEKAGALPPGVRARVKGIADGTRKIVAAMAEDPGDVPAGERFLARYLVAAHSVVDEYLRLAKDSAASQEIVAALIRAEQSLAALDQAFAEERVRLLRNDTMSFRAELAALDKLLKMDGRG